MQERSLLQQLIEYGNSDYYGFHMPGHKRNRQVLGQECCSVLPYEIDITEIDGFDDLHHPQGILKELNQRAAHIYGAEESFVLVNGSTVGLLAAIYSVTSQGDEIIVARNCHKSVYHAVELRELTAHYIYPNMHPWDLNLEISPESVKEALKKFPKSKAVVLVSPTYDGIVSDIEEIAGIAHQAGVPLIVDEAHGAHFGFHPAFPQNAVKSGADLVVHSLHKTLPSFTQTALLHVNGDRVDHLKVKKYLGMFQSSSPSYVLMSSVDACLSFLEEEEKKAYPAFENYVKMLRSAREKFRTLKHLILPELPNMEASKILIFGGDTGLNGKEIYEILLKKYHLQLEMAAGNYCLAMTSVADTEEGFERLFKALQEIDKNYGPKEEKFQPENRENFRNPELDSDENSENPESDSDGNPGNSENPDGLTEQRGKYLPWGEGIGKRALEYAYLYPPGCPILVPGEVITKENVEKLEEYRRKGLSIEGPRFAGKIRCE